MITPTSEINKRFPSGTKVRVIVRSHVRFGYFVDIPGIEIRGLFETVGYEPSEKPNLEIGSTIEAVIQQFRDSKEPLKRQFRLTVHPAVLANPSLIKLLQD
ncbi:hypothetical protein [Acaryochloris marina]|uniref:hypothetical protein n=1 Tax=Acaryochloris marina TaxID=155978 RepID=UPI0005A2E530|nr:hypothetical protein [Acaryochloris marina]BDM79627.1 hypothetical protein AM10699_24950 [Acaryochloris marina MBIC10699]